MTDTTLRLVAPLLVAALAGCASLSSGVEGPAAPPLVISTDRPSFSDGTGIQPLGHPNLETGWTWVRNREDGLETTRHNGPEVLGRFGLCEDRLEFRLISSGISWTRVESSGGDDNVRGWTDPTVGLKWKALDQHGWSPRVAVGAQSGLGVGARDVTSGKMEPVVKGLWSIDLGAAAGDRWSGHTLGGNLNAAFPTTDGERFTQGQASVYLAFPLRGRVSGFVETYSVFPNAKGREAANYADTGILWLVSDRVQLDLRVGLGLNREADDVFAGAGVSFLF